MLARSDVRDNQPLYTNARTMGRVAAAMDHPAAVAQFVGRQAISGFGWLLVVLVVMFLVAGERTAGTADEAIRRLGRRRYLAVKVASVVVVVLAIVAITTVALVAARSTYIQVVTTFTGVGADGRATGSVPVQPDPTWASWPQAAKNALQAGFIVALVAAVAVPVAARCRTMHGFAIGALAAVSSVFALTKLPVTAVSPMTIIDRALQLSNVPAGMRDVRIWDQSSRANDPYFLAIGHSGSWLALAALVAVWAALAAVLGQSFVRRGPRT
jgi:hypothetical protein